MGNRAVITTENYDDNTLGVYLHWNGGRDSVEAFLLYCKLHEYRTPDDDSCGWLSLCTVLGCFFGDGINASVGICNRLDMDNLDNGTYLISGWEIVGREYFDDSEEQSEYELIDMLRSINKNMPTHMKLADDILVKAVADR